MRREDVQRGWECEKGGCSEEGEKFTTSYTSLYT